LAPHASAGGALTVRLGETLRRGRKTSRRFAAQGETCASALSAPCALGRIGDEASGARRRRLALLTERQRRPEHAVDVIDLY
jgi:hypothetical protein